LAACGFAAEDGAKLFKGCRLLERFVRERRADQGSVARLFRSADGYRANIRSIIELRLAQLTTIDAELKRAITKSTEDLPDSPTQALGNMRNIAERSFGLIWSAEFGESRKIPSHLFGHWRDRGARGIEVFERLQIPGELRPQCRLLQLLVGAEQGINRQARHFSQQTYHLLNAVVGYGNYGQHIEGEQVAVGTAVAAIMTAVELAAQLAEKTPSTH
jgi:hypothetical protein